MKQENIKKNLIYNILYQFLNIFLPLITIPIITRHLGATNIGVYSYSYSIANYFMLFGLLGVSNYGSREIAKCRENKDALSVKFWSIYKIQFIVSMTVCLLFLIYAVFLSSYRTVSLIQSLAVISVIFDINWFFFGIEQFKTTISRNIIIKIIAFIMVLLFVNDEEDLWIYTLIMSLSILFSQLVLWFFLFKKVSYVKVPFKKSYKHFKKILVLFIPVISYSIYKIMDKIMIGAMSDIESVAYYENAEKIVGIPIAIITALGTVMLPRISNLVSKKDTFEIKKYINKSFRLVLFIILPMIVLLITFGRELCTFYLGEGFEASGLLLQLLSTTILFVSLANVIRTQFLIPYSRDKEYIFSTIIGAAVNLCLNIILIPKYGAVGACIGTIAAELSVLGYQVFVTRKELNYVYLLKQVIKKSVLSIIPMPVIFCVPIINGDAYFTVIIRCCIYIVAYLLLNAKYLLFLLKTKEY